MNITNGISHKGPIGIILLGLAIILGFFLIGEWLGEWLNLSIPGSVVGMVLLILALLSGLVKIEWVEREAEFLVRNMSILFIPPGVGVVTYLSLIKSQAVPIFAALILSFLVTLVATAKVVELVREKNGRGESK
ncbi:CidA/LrgA family protein [Thermococcus piezophilus]|uniref:Effector of murein hydrolase LrgA n=1 Tax=Thermococcus piezophilus TaxID=1712654 RepID=A0A172WGE8_9EURY|nr:CidA/LrgA family protein [Thermococcus piezophilus]ANF22522.1 effector of murein hydrolase LrgA [Thermococcus piezophilus]